MMAPVVPGPKLLESPETKINQEGVIMARVHTAIAAKDYPDHGISKGDKYWHWTPYRQKRRLSKTPPRASQVESNDTKANLYSITEGLMDSVNMATTVEEIKTAVASAIEECDTVYDEFNEKADNLEEGFGHETQQSEEIRGWAEEVESWKNDLDSVDLEPDEDNQDFDFQEMIQEIPEWSGF